MEEFRRRRRSALAALAARGESLASHRDGRGAPSARRDDREYREYLSEEQRSRRGCIARRMQPDFHHGLLALLVVVSVASACAHTAGISGAKNRFVRLPDGVNIRCLEDGKGPGPTLVFVPGWTMTAEIWEPQITRFRPTHHVVAVDPRAQGQSSKTTEGLYPAARARDLKRVIDQLKLAPVVLVGWSMGVSEVALFVDQFGTKDVAGIVLVDSSLGGDPNAERSLAVVQWLGEVQADRAKATADFVRSLSSGPSPTRISRRSPARRWRRPPRPPSRSMWARWPPARAPRSPRSTNPPSSSTRRARPRILPTNGCGSESPVRGWSGSRAPAMPSSSTRPTDSTRCSTGS